MFIFIELTHLDELGYFAKQLTVGSRQQSTGEKSFGG